MQATARKPLSIKLLGNDNRELSMRFSEDIALERASELIQRVKTASSQISVAIVSDTVTDLEKRPALKATGFLERMISDARLSEIVSEYHRHGIAARVILGFEEFTREAAAGTLFPSQCHIKAVLDMTEGGSHKDGFGYAWRSTGVLVCKLFGFTYLHANAYAAAIARHKHHQTMLMESAGIPVPECWSFRARLHQCVRATARLPTTESAVAKSWRQFHIQCRLTACQEGGVLFQSQEW